MATSSVSLVKVWPGREPWARDDNGWWTCVSLWDSQYLLERAKWNLRILARRGTDVAVSTLDEYKAWARMWKVKYATVALRPPSQKLLGLVKVERKVKRVRAKRSHCRCGAPRDSFATTNSWCAECRRSYQRRRRGTRSPEDRALSCRRGHLRAEHTGKSGCKRCRSAARYARLGHDPVPRKDQARVPRTTRSTD